ncbi:MULTISPECIES: ribose-phosphate pyrophosphokinase [unclassified Duganella]|uniref:ribose-phosphate pyrophosphokinase n=1 Tax=unclassified Duganella TaxID=2636909 RepID=UPI000E34A544|nr:MULTISPECIES: ribose-phosphate pyrophosphokinase [unclassified Duganella]RFP19555.1 ribose-phosphate pyrophosphokinase [Duganella sp. BJB475]RFP36136.1 ribose-phosphate pyrophosphokinase [Duganella sp. BJB476]
MTAMLMALPGAEQFAGHLRGHLGCEVGELLVHRFPDGECCPQLTPAVAGCDVILVAALNQPDHQIMAVYLSACVARELGARSVGLVAPYLPYMRQDASFAPGQGVTARHFARLLSGCFDWLVTVDPHLHRFHQLSEVYQIATEVVPAAPEIAAWIAARVERPVLVGPDEESEQWVGQVAAAAGCPYTVLRKVRGGDREVSVSPPPAALLAGRTPVLVDDIISTARTMIAATQQLKAAGCAPPVCIGVHALFAGAAYAELEAAGAGQILSCDTVPHASNAIGMSAPIAAAVVRALQRC